MDPVFPLEIFTLIIAQLALVGEILSLRSCSLVCRGWVALCRPHLFRHIFLQWYEELFNRPKLRRLVQTLIANPALGEKIQELSCVRLTNDGSILEEYDHVLDECLFMLLDLPNLRHLTILSYPKTIGYNLCRDDIFGYRTIIDRYLDSGKLTRLVLEGIKNLPIHLILACKTLTILELSNLILVAPSTSQKSLPKDTFALERLKLYRVTSFPRSILKHVAASLETLALDHIQYLDDARLTVPHARNEKLIHFGRLTSLTSSSGLDWETFLAEESRAGRKALSAVKHLSVQLLYDDAVHHVSSVNTILDHVQTLENLGLIAMGPYLTLIFPRLSSNVIIGMNHTLKSFSLSIMHDDFSQNFITLLVDSFTSQPHHALENLQLNMTFRLYDPSQIDSSRTTSYQREWRKLASCLMDRDRFSSLRHVGIHTRLRLSVQRFMGYGDKRLEALLKEPLQDEGFFESTNRGFEVKFRWGTLRDFD